MVPVPDFAATLRAAQTGDERAWRDLYDGLSGPLLGYLRGRGARDAENLLGEVFLQLARNLGRFRGNEGALRGWAFMIARNRLVDERRGTARRPHESLGDETTDWLPAPGGVEDEALARLGDGRVRELLDRLTTEQRDVVLLRVVGDLSLEQVGGILGKRVGAVKQLQRRALAALRSELETESGGVSP
jgi:RNA polymerase sigma factor (sigma-70 family)